MAIDTNATFVDALRQSGLLGVDQFNELRNLVARYPDSKALAGQLIQLGWLTPYQVNELFRGQGNGLVLGQYRILERLGEGGMGQVFKARHQALGRIVALKVIRKDRLQSNEAVKRFRREMQMAGQLSHPNVVNAFDADAINGTHFFAMEFVDGTDLSRLVREKGPLPSHRACDCIRQAALGLQHAHEKGMVHRDIKPANLLVSKTPSGIVIKILDMGLARFQATEQEDQTMLSQDGHVIGTPDFMAPEQAKSSSTVDHRADLYSLGCTFYFLLTGKPPFTGGTNIEKLLKHQMDPPPPIEKFRSDVPEGVRLVLRQMLAKKPDERIQTAGTVAAALEPYCKPGSGLHLDKLITRPAVAVAEPVNTPNNAHSPTFYGRKRPTGSLTERLSLAGSSRKRLIAIGASVGIFLLGLFVLILLLASGGGSSKTSPAVASSPTTAAPTQPDTRNTPSTDKKPPVIDPAWRFLYPEATIVFSFNLAQMRKTNVYRQNEDEFKRLLMAFGVETDKFCDGLLLDAERVTVAFPPDDPQRLLLVFQGPLDGKKFKTFVNRARFRPFPINDLPQVEFYDFSTEKNNRWAGGFVTPATFLLTTNPAYAVGGARRFFQNEQRVLKDTELQAALERPNEKAAVYLAIGGQVSVGSMQEKSTLQQAARIKLIRGSIYMNGGVMVELHLTAVDAASVELVETFPATIKLSIQTANKDMGELIDAAFSDKPTRGPGNSVTVRGRFNPKQVRRFLELTGRKDKD
jgi:serine/threonine protein kinase